MIDRSAEGRIDSDDFYYAVREDEYDSPNKDTVSKYIRIYGLTDIGQTKDIIIIPQQINGVDVTQITFYDYV